MQKCSGERTSKAELGVEAPRSTTVSGEMFNTIIASQKLFSGGAFICCCLYTRR
jgi:hypothetical protein